MVVAQWVRRWSTDHRVVQLQAEGSSLGGDTYFDNIYSAMIFISVLLGLIDFSDIVMLLPTRPFVLICLRFVFMKE